MTSYAKISLRKIMKRCKFCGSPVVLLRFPADLGSNVESTKWGAFIEVDPAEFRDPIYTYGTERAFLADTKTRTAFGPLAEGQIEVPMVIPHRCSPSESIE